MHATCREQFYESSTLLTCKGLGIDYGAPPGYMKTNPFSVLLLRSQFQRIITLATLILLVTAPRIKAFSLIGPYTSWMSKTNGYRQAFDIGGPMNLNEEYRWNVPVITYGFDKSFLDYFGSNGVAAVQSAIQVLNDLPAASDTILSNYPPDTRRMNDAASAQGVYDLKSTVLALLLEQLGLGQPVRNVLDIKTWDPSLALSPVCGSSDCPNLADFPRFVIQRNFDPQTLAPTFSVNAILYGGFIETNGFNFNDYVEFPVDPDGIPYSAVAEAFSFWYSGLGSGDFYTGLTRDDVGGLVYLLSATNVNWESLPKNVLFAGTHGQANERLRGAWRPGVEKIHFVPQPQTRRGKFKTAVFKFTASYVANGIISEQPARRVVSQPDILFSVAETIQKDPSSPMFLRTGTDQWTDNAKQNGDPTAAGPGVINPPVGITFDELGPHVLSGGPYNPPVVINRGWSSFDESTNPPVFYPQNTGHTNLLVRLHFYSSASNLYSEVTNSLFHVPVPFGGQATVQISTNQTDWISLATVTNSGSVVRWDYFGTKIPISFRVSPGM